MTDVESTKNSYQEQAQTALEKLRGQIDELRVQADLASADARDRLKETLDSLRKRQAEAKVKLDEAQGAGAEAWKAVAAQAEQLVDDLGDAVSKLADEVQGALSAAGAAATKTKDTFFAEWRKERDARKKLLD